MDRMLCGVLGVVFASDSNSLLPYFSPPGVILPTALMCVISASFTKKD